MKKRYIYVLLIMLLLISIPISKKNDKTFKIDGIKYAVSVDGIDEVSFPEKGLYDVNVQCNGADAYWDFENWQAIVYNITSKVGCDISFTSKTKVNLNTYIKDTLTGTTTGNGQVVNENGYRYEGPNPNNYIKFNNELWRIIGVFDSSSHGQSGQYLTKIIKKDTIGSYAWDKNDVNNWPQSSLYKILNNYYYSAINGTESGYCYMDSTTVKGNCDYTTDGINDIYRPMVKNVTWYLGGYSSESVTPANMYTYERSTSATYYYSSNISYKTTTGYIGLIYASDYGYSALASSCPRTNPISVYHSDACAGQSWLFSNGEIWTITQHTVYSTHVYYLGFYGSVSGGNASWGEAATHPVLYLDSSVYILSGTGSQADPYIIAM